MRPRRAIRFDDPVVLCTAIAPASGGRVSPPQERSGAYRLGLWLGGALPTLSWWGLVLLGGPVSLYLWPALVAYRTRHPHRHGLLVWTVLVGWTGTGWVAAWLYLWWVR